MTSTQTSPPFVGPVRRFAVNPKELDEVEPYDMKTEHKAEWTPVPSTYGNNAEPAGERPGEIRRREYDFDRLLQIWPAPDPASSDATEPGTLFSLRAPVEIELPFQLVGALQLDEGQVHALHVGVGRKSMDDRWMGRLFFQADGTVVLPLLRTWSGRQIFELTFRPVAQAQRQIQITPATSTSRYADAPLDQLPEKFPSLVLVRMRREGDQEIYSRPLPETKKTSPLSSAPSASRSTVDRPAASSPEPAAQSSSFWTETVARAFSLTTARDRPATSVTEPSQIETEFISLAAAREELRAVLWIVTILLSMRVGIDAETWETY